uniref:Uncharacterized protein n=1 Tax=Panagrellus redivivus TaxID=6233 RepID=A0A7E4W7D4_PANRE
MEVHIWLPMPVTVLPSFAGSRRCLYELSLETPADDVPLNIISKYLTKTAVTFTVNWMPAPHSTMPCKHSLAFPNRES